MIKFTSTYKNSKLCGVYQIRNLKTQKIYIGSSKAIEYRCYEHRKNLIKNKHQNQYLQNSWNKHGENNFIFEILEECSEEKLLEREQSFINETKSSNRKHGYNICEIANKPWMTEEIRAKISETLKGNIPWNLGIPHTEEAKSKMSKPRPTMQGKNHPQFGKSMPEETREKIRQANLMWLKNNAPNFQGRKHSEETKEKIRQLKLGVKMSEEAKKKMSESRRGKPWSEKHRQSCIAAIEKCSKQVAQFSLDGNLIRKFKSISEAERLTGVTCISECANGKRKKAGGYVWKFI